VVINRKSQSVDYGRLICALICRGGHLRANDRRRDCHPATQTKPEELRAVNLRTGRQKEPSPHYIKAYLRPKEVFDIKFCFSIPFSKSLPRFRRFSLQRLADLLVSRNKSRSKWAWTHIFSISVCEDINGNLTALKVSLKLPLKYLFIQGWLDIERPH
jgi:hypothetical protein